MQIRRFDPHKPSDVRQFVKEIARLTAGGPIGSAQAERMIQELSQTAEGRELLSRARQAAKIDAQSLGIDFKNVKLYTDADPSAAKNTLTAQAFVAGNDIYLSASTNATQANTSAQLLAHELAHVVHQTAGKGKK
jgi:hypothetical protein